MITVTNTSRLGETFSPTGEPATYLKHDLVPPEPTTPPAFDALQNTEEARAYARKGFHAVVTKWETLNNPMTALTWKPAFEVAAKAYYEAVGYTGWGYDTAYKLASLKALLHTANVAAAQAFALAAPSAVPGKPAAPPKTGPAADAAADQHVGAGGHKILWALLAVGATVGAAVIVVRTKRPRKVRA